MFAAEKEKTPILFMSFVNKFHKYIIINSLNHLQYWPDIVSSRFSQVFDPILSAYFKYIFVMLYHVYIDTDDDVRCHAAMGVARGGNGNASLPL